MILNRYFFARLFLAARPKGRVANDNQRTQRGPSGTALKAKIVVLITVLALSSITSAAVVHKIDDTTVTGDLQSIADGKLTLGTTAAPVVIPFGEIAQIVIKQPPAPVQPAPEPVADAVQPPQDESPGIGGTLLGALFGGSHSHVRAEPTAATVTPTVVTAAPTSQPTTVPTLNLTGLFKLTDSDQIHANLKSWADQKLSLQLSDGTSLELPSSDITEIWLGTQELQGKAQKVTIDPGPEDIALVAKDNDVVAVKGFVRGITGDSLQFRYDDQDRKINLSKVVGLLLRGNSPSPITAFHQSIHTDSGDQFSGVLSAIDHDSVTLTTTSGSPVKVSLSSITTIDFLNGRVTFLTDLKPTKVEQTPYFGRLIPYRINQSLTGGPLVLSDGTYPRGIAVHSRCLLQYDVSSGFDRFKTKMGFQQPDGRQGRVLARVLGDGKPLYENPDARGDQPPVDLDIPLNGIKTLTLEIDFGKDQDVGDRVVWANPRLLRGK